MAHEVITQVKRTIWVAKCEHINEVRTEKSSKELWCSDCRKWLPFVEQSYIGPSLGK